LFFVIFGGLKLFENILFAKYCKKFTFCRTMKNYLDNGAICFATSAQSSAKSGIFLENFPSCHSFA